MVTQQLETGLDTDIIEEIGDFIQDATGVPADLGMLQRQAAADPSIPTGAVLAESEFGGAMFRWTKRDSRVHAGGRPLPERFAAYDRNNIISMLPTAMMATKLSQRDPLDPSKRWFRLAKHGPWPDRPVPTPVPDLTCEICNRHRPPGNPKRFWRVDQVEPHMNAAHAQTWQAQLRIQREEREKAAQLTNERLLEAQLRQLDLMRELMMQGRTQAALEVAQGAGMDTTPAEAVAPSFSCPKCGVALKGPRSLPLHLRRWCPEKDSVI